MTEREAELLNTERRELCRIHSKRLDKVEERQRRIYESMFGPNGDPSEGWAWKLEQSLLWLYGDPKTKRKGVVEEWGDIKKVALTGAWSAIWLLLAAAASGIGWLVWQFVKHMIATGWKP